MEKDDLDYLLPSNGPNPYYDTWDRHNSIAFSTATKGLHNAPGENNCFVNSAVQVFWHLDVFRRSYRRLSGHTCMGNSCIFCALKVIFTQFQFSDQSSLHPDALRKALADTFANQQRFQLGHMDDAAECFENILKRIHFHIAHNHPEDTCTAPHCLPHQKFSLGIVEKVVCPCGASSKPFQYREMVHYISVSALVSQAQMMQDSGDVLHPDRFGLLLRSANALGDIRQCPGSCGKTVQIRRTLLNIPDVVSIGLGWDSDHPTMEMTTKVARSIGTAILLQDVFHSVMQDKSSLPKLQLVGLVCYYCKHYSTFVFHSKLGVWIYFDDTTVKEIGPSFDHVVDKCSRGRYQPLLLLYANPNSSPVTVDSAPKKRVMAPGYHLPGSEDENTLDRTHESISSQSSVQRAMTPNPEPSSQMADTSYTRARSVTPSSHDAANRREAPSPSLSGFEHNRQQSFMMAMSKADPKNRHPLRMGGQSGIAGMPGPMTPVQEQDSPQKHGSGGAHYQQHPHHASQQSSAFHRPDQPDPHNTSYADYTLSNNNQYKRPALTGFTPDDLPLTPNQKGNTSGDSPRKDSFKRNKEPIRADIIRHPSDSSSSKMSTGYGSNSSNSNYQDYNTSQQQARTNMRSSAMFYQGPGSNNPHFRQRSLSQGGDEAYASDSSEYSRPVADHVVVKPMAAGLGTDNDDKHNSYAHTHTAVQSGLATLPRKKKNQTVEESKNSQNMMMGSNNGGVNSHNFRPVSNPQYDMSRHTPVMDSSGLPIMGPGRVTSPILLDQTDGGVKKSGKDESEKEKKFLKKAKKELKKSEKKKMRSNPNASAVETALMTRSASADEDVLSKTLADADISDEQRYINRKMVASVLKHQGLQRQPSTHSTNSQTSNSSLESEGIMSKLLAAKAHGDASFDNVSLGSHKDSGYGSSDRNSSSSTGSGTIDPSVQYFLSKSMVIPRNFNSQMFERQSQQFVTDFTAPTPHVYPSQYGSQGEGHNTETMSTAEDKNRLGYQPIGQRKVMHPIKESSQEDMLKIMPKEVLDAGKQSPRSSPIPDSLQSKEGRPPPIPPKNFAAFIVSKSAHQREPSIDSLDKDEVKNDYFVSMCEKADDLMDRCILAETQENLSDALRYCDSALGCLKEAMNQMDIEKNAAIYAQKKHKSCLLKSRSLFKRVSSQTNGDRAGKRSSITSTDSDNSDKLVRRAPSKERLMASGRSSANSLHHLPHHQKDVCNSSLDSTGSARQSPMPGSQVPEGMQAKIDPAFSHHGLRYDSVPTSQQPPTSLSKDNGEKLLKSHVSRAQMENRSDSGSNHSRSGSNSSVRSSISVPCSLSSQQQQQQQIMAPMLPKSQSSIGPISSSSNSGPVPLDPYGTLPRNRKPRRTSDPTGNSADSYQMFVNKQKQLHMGNGSDRCSTDSRDSDSSSNDGNPQRKSSKAEIRELLENNFVQQQKQQLMTGPGVATTDQGNGPATRTRHSYEGSGSSTSHPTPSSVHQNKGQSAAAAQYQQSRQGAVRHSLGGQGQAKSSPPPMMPMPHDQGAMTRPVVTNSNPSMSRMQATSPSPYHPNTQQERSPTQLHYIDNINNPQRQISTSALPTSSASSSSSPQRPQPQAYPASSSHQQHQNPPSSSTSSSLPSHPPHTVSGYNQALPGHRIPPSTNTTRPTSSYSSASTTTPTPSSTHPHHHHPSSSPTPSPIQFTQRSPNYPPTAAPTTTRPSFPHSSSQSNYAPIPTQSSLQAIPPASHEANTNRPSVQGGSIPSTQHQNLSPPSSQMPRSQPTPQDPRRPGGVQPPPPPARTTSNPDFRVQLIQQPSTANQNTQSSQPRNNNIHHQQQQQQNVARVQPNSHLMSAHPSSRSQTPTSSGLQQEPLQFHHHHRQGPPPAPSSYNSTASSNASSSTNRYSFTSAPLSQSGYSATSMLKHAYSSTGLNTIAAVSMAPRPLERCTSQPDCQNLPEVDPYSSDRDGSSFLPPPLRHAASHHPVNPNNATAAARPESGPSMRLGAQTSNSPGTAMERQQSVKDLLSRFDQPNANTLKPAVKPKPSTTRNRSKSESGSKKPKSVLKSKKAKSGSGKSRKSVTFAQDFSEKASGYESAAELSSFSSSAPINDRAYFSDDEEHSSSYYGRGRCDNEDPDDVEVDSSNSDEAPPPEELACQLCHKREIETGRAYCSKCYFYMSRLTS